MGRCRQALKAFGTHPGDIFNIVNFFYIAGRIFETTPGGSWGGYGRARLHAWAAETGMGVAWPASCKRATLSGTDFANKFIKPLFCCF
jgi:hypothetical protein